VVCLRKDLLLGLIVVIVVVVFVFGSGQLLNMSASCGRLFWDDGYSSLLYGGNNCGIEYDWTGCPSVSVLVDGVVVYTHSNGGCTSVWTGFDPGCGLHDVELIVGGVSSGVSSYDFSCSGGSSTSSSSFTSGGVPVAVTSVNAPVSFGFDLSGWFKGLFGGWF